MTHDASTLSDRLLQLNAQSLSPMGRYGHVALLLAALAMAALLVALLATENALPPRTAAAMAVMLAMAAGWIGYAAWVLTQRRPLLARHRVVAGGMAVGFSATFVAATVGLAAITGTVGFLLASALGAAMLGVAIALLVRARRQREHLLALRRDLEALVGAPR